MFGGDDESVYLIDIPDFSHNAEDVKNHRYSPENIDGSSANQRDNFAVLRMSSELLGITWGGVSEKYRTIAEAIRAVGRCGVWLQGLESVRALSNLWCRCIGAKGHRSLLEQHPGRDNNLARQRASLCKVEPSRQGSDILLVTFSGIGGSFSAFYNKAQQCFNGGLQPRIRSTVHFKDVEQSQFGKLASLSRSDLDVLLSSQSCLSIYVPTKRLTGQLKHSKNCHRKTKTQS